MNTPNKLTLSRIFLIPFFIVFLHVHQITANLVTVAAFRWAALAVFIIAAVTDYLDGAIARSRNIVTSFGKLFDPLADKLLTMSAFVAFVELRGPNDKPIFPAWAIIIILAREFLVTGLRSVAISHGKLIHADTMGKHKTVWQLVGIIMILVLISARESLAAAHRSTAALDHWLPPLFLIILIAVTGITAVSGVAFLLKNWSVVSDRD